MAEFENITPNPRTPKKGDEAYLSPDERKFVGRMMSYPEDIPLKFKSWMTDYLAVNIPQIPISQIVGFDKYLYSKGTALPENPKDGQPYSFIADSQQGTIWRFQYNAQSTSQYKWEFVGGSPVQVRADGGTSTASGGYVSAGGPSLTIPLNGDYLVYFGCEMWNSSEDSDTFCSVYNGTGVSDSDSISLEGIITNAGTSPIRITMGRAVVVEVGGATKQIEMRYRVGSGTGSYQRRWMIVQPVRVK